MAASPSSISACRSVSVSVPPRYGASAYRPRRSEWLKISPLYDSHHRPPSPGIGWWPSGLGSTMERRAWASPTWPTISTPWSSGPRGYSARARRSSASRSGALPGRTTHPPIPHTPAILWDLCGGGRGLLDVPRQQRLASDDEPLDLRGALVELHDLRVAHELLDRVLLDEAVPAVDLHGVGGDLHRGVGREALGARGLQRVAGALVEQHGAVPRGQARQVHLRRHVGDHELDRLVHGDRHAELDALLGVLGGELEGRARDAGGHRRHAGARAVEGHHRELEALVLLADEVAGVDLGLVEGDGRGVGGPLAHLVFLLVHDHRVVLAHEEGGDAAMAGVGVGLGVDREPVGVAAVGDEALRAVDDVLVALAHGAGAHARDVGAGIGLGQAERGELRRGQQVVAVLLLDLLGGADEDRRGGQAVGAQRRLDARAAPRELLLDEATVEVGEAWTAVLLG